MRYLILTVLLFSNWTAAFAQVRGQSQLNYTFSGPSATTPVLEVPIAHPKHYVSFALRCTGASTAGDFEFRSAVDGVGWTDWQALHDDVHGEEPAGRRQFELLFLPVETRQLQLRAAGLESPLQMELFFFSPVDAPDTDPVATPSTVVSRACPCALPNQVNRAAWGGPPNQQSGCTPSYANVTHLFVHHQAGVANPPYASVVLGIWQFHVFTRGWCDIGYNWVIAPDGTLFEGRAGGNNVVGAHVSGLNSVSMGVCLLGDFQTDQPTPAALETLRRLLAWKSCDSNIDPVGSSVPVGSTLLLNHISGHRDGGSTLCPGDNLYAQLPNLRINVDTLYSDPTGCDGLWPPDNDECDNAITLFSAETCQAIPATTDGATASNVPIPTCNGFTSPTALDVWFRFGATEDHHQVIVTPTGNLPGALDAVVAVYSGSCATLQFEACADVPGGPGIKTTLDLTDLTPGKIYYIRVYDYGNTPASDGRFDICVVHGAAVSTSEAGQAQNLRVVPNPTQGWVRINLPPGGENLQVFNLEGRLVKSQRVSSDVTDLDLSAFPPGVYLAVLRTAEGVWKQKIVLY